MSLFLPLFLKLLPLYAIVGAGVVAQRKMGIDRQQVATLVFYFMTPVVVFNGAMRVHLTPAVLLLPVAVFTVCCLLCLVVYRLAAPYWKDSTRNILAFAAGNANTGYFGLPVALAVFGEQGANVYILAMLGMILYENSLGFYITARGQHAGREVLRKIVRLPSLWAFFLGLAVNLTGFVPPEPMADLIVSVRGAYTVLGMMIIGLALAGISAESRDRRFVMVSLTIKFVVWPLLIVGLTQFDVRVLHLWSAEAHRALLLISLCPLAANTVVLATLLGTQPEKAAAAVLISTLIAMVYVPLMVAWLL